MRVHDSGWVGGVCASLASVAAREGEIGEDWGMGMEEGV